MNANKMNPEKLDCVRSYAPLELVDCKTLDGASVELDPSETGELPYLL